ncbi:MAG TPA: XrtA system polysaccharide deacetylase [Acetobacteraceae bacterium]|nr:XrtA system polysaccharide deacetylase [Acetobacteraceae bacterium]
MSQSVPINAVPVVNAMTVDVEDWFQVQAFAHCIGRDQWDGKEARVEANIERILALFESAGVHATFFTLGWIAERHPAIVHRIVAAGHELASHGWEHIRANTQDAATFRADVARTRRTLEDIGGVSVVGYRAATFSIGAQNLWAFRELEEAGYAYSSSINPIRHDLYGMPDAPRTPFRPDGGALWEIPMTTVAAFGRNWPCAGGGFFRLLPYEVYRRGLSAVNGREQLPGIFYFHPWEVDPGQPRVSRAGWKSRLRHYTNLSRMHGKLERLLGDFAWDRMDRVFAGLLADDQVGSGNDAGSQLSVPPSPSGKANGSLVGSAAASA